MLRDAEAGSPVNRVQDREYPPRDQLSYENYLVAILGGEVDCFFNFAFKSLKSLSSFAVKGEM